jgi:uncharacterized protein (TIGR03437 family)
VAPAQVCRLTVAGLNNNRRVMGPVNTECPDPLHTSPFGNWGVTSNFGQKQDGYQFEGWCENNQEIVDNLGGRRRVCGTRWREWNSCTDNFLFRAPNCTLYNAEGCTQQVSTKGADVVGTQIEDIPVACPADTDGDGQLDTGGCSSIRQYTRGSNFMSVYELDPLSTDDLIQTLIYPEALVEMTCDFWGCLPAGSQWMEPIAYDSPKSPPIIHAEMAVAVGSGVFVDSSGVCKATGALKTVSAASYSGPVLARDSIASGFGGSLSQSTEAALAGIALPSTLAGVRVSLIDQSQRSYTASLFFVSPDQVNFLVPSSLPDGPATIRILGPNGEERATGLVEIAPVAPALFAANANGKGVAAAIAVRVGAGGDQTVETVFRCEGSGGCTAVALDPASGGEQLILSLFGTGIRGRNSSAAVEVLVGGERAEVLYAGAQLQYPGLDQINVILPRSLAGRGEVEVALRVDGVAANIVTISVR